METIAQAWNYSDARNILIATGVCIIVFLIYALITKKNPELGYWNSRGLIVVIAIVLFFILSFIFGFNSQEAIGITFKHLVPGN